MKKKNLIVLALVLVMVKVDAQTFAFAAIDSLFENGRYKLALLQLDKLPSTFESNFKKALIYESIDNYKKTVEFLEKAIVFKKTYKVQLKLAKAYQRLRKLNKSIKIYEKITLKDSLNLVLKYQLGKLYLISKKADKAINTFKYLTRKDSANAHYSYQLALSYAIKNDRDRMINSFLDTYKKDSLHLKTIVRLATSFNKLKDIDSTKIFVDKGLFIDVNHINLNKIKINQLYRDKMYLKAIPYLLRIDTITRNDTYPTSMLGRTYYNLDSLDKAKKYFKKLWKIDKENYKSWTYQGHIAMKQKNLVVAQMNYRMATFIAKEKRDEEYYGLASAYYEMKKTKEAIFNFKKAYSENRLNYKALFQLAKLSDGYFKDKKVAYKHYVSYLDKFLEKDEVMTNFVKKRVSELKKESFMNGLTLE